MINVRPVKWWATVGFVVAALSLQAQWYDVEKVNKKARMVYNTAISQLSDGQWATGKSLLQQAIRLEPRFVDAWLSMAGVYGQLKQYDSAVYYYSRSMELDSIYASDMLLPYSINLAGGGNFAAAKEKIETFLAKPRLDERSKRAAEFRLKTYVFALQLAQKKGTPTDFVPENLGDSINSRRSEYYPSFTIDGRTLVFTRRGDGIREDFIKAEKINGIYEKATPLQGALNQQPSKGGLIISQDGQQLIFAGNFQGQGFGDFDLYLCEATPDGWSLPYNLGSQVNTEFWESSPTLSPDKQELYFSSNRPGGFGGKDLYISRRLPNGRWGKAENMGPNFNTASDELAPFIHADNQTLFFTSGGHPGYGGSDIYRCRKGPGGTWSLPENLGYPINTIEDEGSLSVAADGKTAYFASYRTDSRGGLDLYWFELPTAVRPLTTQWVRGKVYDAVTGTGLPAAIELRNTANGEIVQRVITDETGKYLVTLPEGSEYSFTVNRKGYLYFSSRFKPATGYPDTTFTKDIPLKPITINATTELADILYETNAFKLQPTSFTELDKLVKLLQENPSLRVEIRGHTDNVGKAADNLLLSTNRAKSVVDYLKSKGIAAERLSFKGLGATRPVAENTSEAGRAKNRRTEMVVTGY